MRGVILVSVLLLSGCSGPGSAPSGGQARSVDVRDFVRRTYLHGVPYEQALRYGSEDVAVLRRMLADPAEEAHWANAVVTLCMIGTEPAIQAALAFIQDEDARLVSSAHYRAKSSAIMALGYGVQRAGDERCLSFLQEACSPSYWSARGIAWRELAGPVGTQRDRELSTMAILGLGLAGTQEAREALIRLADEDDPFARSSAELIRAALESNRQIERLGLVEYYKSGQH